jgi:hypothetical protein
MQTGALTEQQALSTLSLVGQALVAWSLILSLGGAGMHGSLVLFRSALALHFAA